MFLSRLLAETLAVAFIAAYKLTLTMPASMSLDRRILLRTFVAELHITDPARLVLYCILPFIQETTGPEIWRDSAGKVDALVAGIGTITGAGKFLKERNPGIKRIGAGIVPDVLDVNLLDEIIQERDQKILGSSSLYVGLHTGSFKNNKGMVVFPGFRARYLSSQLFESYKHEADISLQGTATSLPLG